jgi:hypothetical protein
VASIRVVVRLLGTSVWLGFDSPTTSPQGPYLGVVPQWFNLTPPECPNETGPMANLAAASGHFTVGLAGWCTAFPDIRGTGTEPDGRADSILVGVPVEPLWLRGWTNWTSPDGTFGLDDNQGPTVVLWSSATVDVLSR